jgi:thymidylate kinase
MHTRLFTRKPVIAAASTALAIGTYFYGQPKGTTSQPNRGTMVLIEGLDLAGKSTLTRQIIEHAKSNHIDISTSRNALVPTNPIALIADEYRRDKKAGYLETGALFLAAHEYDAIEFKYPAPGKVHIQDSSWLRTLAFHTLHKTRWIPDLVKSVSRHQPEFDAVIYLTASTAVRQQRVLKREKEAPHENDHSDYLCFSNPKKLEQLDQLLLAKTQEVYPHVKVIDTTNVKPDVLLQQCLPLIYKQQVDSTADHSKRPTASP